MDLKTKLIKSTVWYSGTRLWIQAVSWVVTIVLARTLAPEDYGLFAMAFSVITFMELFQEFGLGVTIIQRPSFSKEQINASFWVLFSVSVLIVAVTFMAAWPLATFYNEPRLVWLIRILSLTFLFNSVGTIPYSLLTKEIDFRRRSLAEACAVVVSSGISLAMAYGGYGVWALALGQLARSGVSSSVMFISSKWVPGFQMSFAEMREIFKFSLHVAGGSALGSLSDSLNSAIVGRFLGGYNLGLYSMAFGLGKSSPLHKLSTAVINQLSLPLFSNLQRETEELKKYFLRITKYLAVISLPTQVGMALVARDLILVLLSEKWSPITELFQLFAIGGVFSIIILPSYPLLTARGRADTTFHYALVSSLLITAVYFVGAQWSLRGVAFGWLVVFPAIRLYLLKLSLREIGISFRKYLENIATPILAVMFMMLVVTVIRILTEPLGPLERLFVTVPVGAAVYTFFLLLMDRNLTTELKTIAFALFASTTPRAISRV
jgi:O-antigen/teichoic acid export membrane protein